MNSARLLICLALLGAAECAETPPGGPIEAALNRMYNFDFNSAHAILDEYGKTASGDPLAQSVRAAALLFSEFHRLGILESEFLGDDDRLTDKKRLKPDPLKRAQLFAATQKARQRAGSALAASHWDRNARFALCMAIGIELEYTLAVEKRYFRAYSLSKESQRCARVGIAMDPPIYDSYLTIGTAEYFVGSLNPFFRFFMRFEKIEGNRRTGMELLKMVSEKGHYYRAFARIMLAVTYLREKDLGNALTTVEGLAHDFPENPLFRRECGRIAELIARQKRGKK